MSYEPQRENRRDRRCPKVMAYFRERRSGIIIEETPSTVTINWHGVRLTRVASEVIRRDVVDFWPGEERRHRGDRRH